MKTRTSDASIESNDQIAQSQVVAFEQFVEQFKEESDRAAVILAVSKLDSLLYQILSRFLIASSSTKDDLFDGDSAPLSTFSGKILMCHRLGIIRADFFRALNLVRKIRNTFAHEVGDARLEAEANRNRIRDLGLIVSHSETYNDIKHRFFKDKTEPSSAFFTTVTLMIAKLEAIYLKVTPLVDANAYHLVSPKR